MFYLFSLRLFLFADYDDYLDDDDLDLIEENLGVKVKRRVSICNGHLCILMSIITVSLIQLELLVLRVFPSYYTEEKI